LPAALEEVVSGGADHIGHLDGWPRHLFRTAAAEASGGEGQSVERTGGRVETVLREVKVDRCFFQIAMAKQNLNGSQICTGFEQVGGETVPPMPGPA
jgi:hypothetical protein